jgi:FAD/FMN-containing dehydrogenase
MTTAATTTILRLEPRLRGGMIVPGHPDYDAARAIDNRSRDSHPAAVVRCADASDVAETVRFAATEGLPLAIRAGGHSAAGFSSVESGMVADLRDINHVLVDTERRVAAIGGGALAGQVDRAAHPFGLATTTATVSTVGVAGFALSGGIGYLTRKHGLGVDNLIGADVVLADGSLVRAGEGGDEDLLWALQGGGGNVGVVTELRMRLHPVSVVTGGPMLFPLERAERLTRLYRDWMPQQADDIYAFLALLTTPPSDTFPEDMRMRPVCALIWCNTASDDQSNAALAAFRGQDPLLDLVRPMPYPELQSAFDAGAAAGKYGHLTGALFEDLPDAAVAQFEPFGRSAPTPLCQSHLYPLDGAAARPGNTDTAWPWRDAAFAQMFAAIAPAPGLDISLQAWSTGFRDALRPYAMPGCYANFQMDDGPHAARACYGTNAARLAQLKGRYDPANLFRLNQNIEPETIAKT